MKNKDLTSTLKMTATEQANKQANKQATAPHALLSDFIHHSHVGAVRTPPA